MGIRVPGSEPRNYLDLMSMTPYKARSDIRLTLQNGQELIIHTGNIFHFSPANQRVQINVNGTTVYVDPKCKGLEELDVDEV
jgi:hypothetical protein